MMVKNKNQSNNTIANSSGGITRKNKWDQLLSALPLGLGSSKPVVAVLRLEGVIGKIGTLKTGLTLNSLNKLIEKTFNLDRLEAVFLSINSPGGSPVQSELIASRIRELADEKEIAVYSFVEDVAASGGYWLACAGDKIYASYSSIVGSIGVVSSGFGFHEAIEKLGVERRIYTEGNTKSILDPFQPAKESDIKIIKKIQKEIHNHFISTVKARRAGRLTQSDEILFNGQFWTGQTAVDYGLIDGIDNLYSFIQAKYGNNVKIEYIETKQPWFKKKLGMVNNSEIFAENLASSLVDVAEKRLTYSKFDIR